MLNVGVVQNQPVSGEQWKDVNGYEGLYSVSDKGRVRSETTKDGNGNKLILSQYDKDGYRMVSLRKDGKRKVCRVHQLVMKAFIPNPQNYTMVNHINEIRSDNRIENLEWCDAKHNSNCGTVKERRSKTLREKSLLKKRVQCYDKETGSFFKEFLGVKEAAREMKIDSANISRCINGSQKSAGGYIWKYVKEDKN